MGDIIKIYPVRSSTREKEKRLRFYFDNGSPRTFMKESVAVKMKNVLKLSEPVVFGGLGNGSFSGTHGVYFHVKLMGIWVPHFCFAVSDSVIEEHYDVLLGHDFMQLYDITLRPKTKEVLIRKEALKLALRVR